jgi:hypothetical protein
MDDETRRAISDKLGLELESVRRKVTSYIAPKATGSNGPLALHQGFLHLKTDLMPNLVDDLINYCLDVGVRDAEVIARQLQDGLLTPLTNLGHSLAASWQGHNPGVAQREGIEFAASVSAFMNQIPARARVAVQARLNADGPKREENGPTGGDKALVFVSCGQVTEAEKKLGHDICELINGTPGLMAFYAERVNSVEALSTSIFRNLRRAVGLVTVMHHRGRVQGLDGDLSRNRASVWIEQEIAIAAFIRATEDRDIKIAAYAEPGLTLEGVRENLHLNMVLFSTPEDVLADLRSRLVDWNLQPAEKGGLRPRGDPLREAREEVVLALDQAMSMYQLPGGYVPIPDPREPEKRAQKQRDLAAVEDKHRKLQRLDRASPFRHLADTTLDLLRELASDRSYDVDKATAFARMLTDLRTLLG